MSGPLILASASPRRAEILTQIGVPFVTCPTDIDETAMPGESVETLVIRLSHEKALAAQQLHPTSWILASDTVVVSRHHVLFGKPTDQDHAIEMLMQLSGTEHRVVTGVAILQGDQVRTDMSVTHVTMTPFSRDTAAAYWRTGEPLGKAGGYAIQGYGAALIRAIRGSYTGVVGLPVDVVVPLLQQCNIGIWQPHSVKE